MVDSLFPLAAVAEPELARVELESSSGASSRLALDGVVAENSSREPTALVVQDPRVARAELDWSSWYLTDEEDVGQSTEQGNMIFELLSALREWARERDWSSVLVATDQFFAWIPSEPLVRVSPDIYLLDDPPGPPWPESWQTWLPEHRPPRFAIEVVSSRTRAKDYRINPRKYAQLGANELVIIDPEALDPESSWPAIQVYTREADGAFVLVHIGDGPAYCREIAAFILLEVDALGERHARLSRDMRGRDVIRTASERADAQEARADAQEARADAQEARADAHEARAATERARADAAKARADAAEKKLRDIEQSL